jgi:hypothetical protein
MLCEHPARAECNDPIRSPAERPRQRLEGKSHHGQVTGGAQRHWFPPVTVQAAPLPAAQVATRQTETRCNTRRLDGSWTQPSHHSTSAQPAHEHSPHIHPSHAFSHPADTRHRALCARHRVHRLILCSKWLPHMVRSVLILSEREEHWRVWVPVRHNGAAWGLVMQHCCIAAGVTRLGGPPREALYTVALRDGSSSTEPSQ